MKKLLTFLTLFTLFTGVGWAANVIMAYSGSTTTNMTGNNDAATVGLNASEWSVVAYKGGHTLYPGLNKSGYIALYYNDTESNYINVSSLNGSTITSIIVTYVKNYENAYVQVNGSNVNGSSSSGLETYVEKTYSINSSSFVIGNANSSSAQVRFTEILIEYSTGTTLVCAAPTFSPASGNYDEPQDVSISCETSGATIYYTTDGTTPTTSSSVYSTAIPVSTTTTIKAMAAATGYENSAMASATYTIEAPSTDEYELVTNASQLSAGDQIIIANTATAGSGYALSTSGTNNRTGTTVTIANSKITPSSSVQILTLEKEGDNWLFNTGSGYLYAASSTANQLKTETTADANAQATISISSNAATIDFQGTNTRNRIRYNPNNGSPIFSCYASSSTTGNLPYIYKKATSTTSDKLYLIGNGMNSQSGWNISTGPEFSYNSTAGTYAVDAYFDMADRCYFQFVEGLSDSNSNWGGLTGRYYATSNDGDVAVDNYDMDGTVPLYFTNSTDYSPGQYAFSVPAGIYTIVVDKTNWQIYVTQHPAIVSINDHTSSSFTEYFTGSTTATLASNLTELGGKIYYTTDDSDPLTSSTRQEYSEPFTITTNTTVKACAEFNYIKTDVVSMSFIKTPAAPVISPASCTFNESLTVSITAEEGATIYYTTDGTDPRNSETRIEYTGSFAVSTTTTVKARAFFGENYGQMAEATYTYSNVQPSTGDFVLVTSADQLVAGNEYIIVAKYNGTNYAMGTISGNKGQSTNDFTLDGTIGVSGSTIAAGTAVNVFTLEASDNNWKFKLSDNSYIEMPSSTNINTGNNGTAMTITLNNNLAEIVGSATPTRLILFSSSNNVFGNYASSNAGTSGYSSGVYLYTRASNAVQNPVFSPVPGIYNVDIDVTISCATDGATIYYTTDGSEPTTSSTQYTGEIMVSESTTFKAIAVKDGNTSSVVTAAYTIQKSTDIATVTLTYSEPFTAGIGDFTINNVSGFSPVWSLDGNYGVKGTSFSNGTNYAAVSRLVSPIIDMTGSVQPELSFSHQINKYFANVTTQCQVFIRETSNGTSGTWVQIPITFSDPVAAGGWTNDVVDIDLTDINGVSYADKKVQISFLYTNPTEGSGAGTWEIQNFVVADNSEYRMVNNIAEFLALENGTKAKFKNPVTVLYDYAQRGTQEYIWVKDGSGYMQFFLQPTLNSSTESTLDSKAAYYENGDIIPAGFVVVKNYFENGKYVQAYSTEALDAGFLPATQKGLADPDHYEFSTLDELTLSDADIAANCNRYITVEKVKIASKSGKNFTFANENDIVNVCVGYNKYNGDGSLLKDGTTSADVTVPAVSNTYYNVTGIIQIWQGGWELMPIEFTEWKADEVTLRKLCADGVETNEYTISNNLIGVYASADGTKLWVKDDNGQSLNETEPVSGEKNYEIEAPGNTRSEQAYYDQSNWCELQLTADNAELFVGKIIKGGSIQGTLTNKTNPMMTNVSLTVDDIYSDGDYEPNYYCMANFLDYSGDHLSQHSDIDNEDYFFMNPKPQEVAVITWAMYDGEKFVIPAKGKTTDTETGLTYNVNNWDFNGAVGVDWSLNIAKPEEDQNMQTMLADATNVYQFKAVIRKIENSQVGIKAPRADGDGVSPKPDQTASSNFKVYPLDLQADENHSSVITGVNDLKSADGATEVARYNVAGMRVDSNYRGVVIIVMSDGSARKAVVK